MNTWEPILSTGSQLIHRFTILAASSGTWFFLWALSSGATGAHRTAGLSR